MTDGVIRRDRRPLCHSSSFRNALPVMNVGGGAPTRQGRPVLLTAAWRVLFSAGVHDTKNPNSSRGHGNDSACAAGGILLPHESVDKGLVWIHDTFSLEGRRNGRFID
jgi:hypothetical protein